MISFLCASSPLFWGPGYSTIDMKSGRVYHNDILMSPVLLNMLKITHKITNPQILQAESNFLSDLKSGTCLTVTREQGTSPKFSQKTMQKHVKSPASCIRVQPSLLLNWVERQNIVFENLNNQ